MVAWTSATAAKIMDHLRRINPSHSGWDVAGSCRDGFSIEFSLRPPMLLGEKVGYILQLETIVKHVSLGVAPV
jgi:hypothetical protein